MTAATGFSASAYHPKAGSAQVPGKILAFTRPGKEFKKGSVAIATADSDDAEAMHPLISSNTGLERPTYIQVAATRC